MKLYSKVLEVLSTHQVKRVFGVPGDAINPLIEALRKYDEIEYIHVSHEEAGAFAASAAAKVSGDLQVCAGTVGPGAIHLLNGLYDAKKDRAPVLAILGQVPTEYLGTDYHQEVDLTRLFRDVAGFLGEIRSPKQTPQLVTEACNSAVSNRSVSVLIVPHDVGSCEVDDLPISPFDPSDAGVLNPAPQLLDEVARHLEGAKRIALMLGEGARRCRKSLIGLSEHLAAPIILSLRGKDLISYEHPNVAGGLGLLGSRGGVAAMDGCDLLLVIGADFPYKEWYNEKCDVIQVDRRARVLGRRRPGAFGVQAEAELVIDWILNHTAAKTNTDFLDEVRGAKGRWDAVLQEEESLKRSRSEIHPQSVARVVSDLADRNAVFCCDTGEVTVWAARHLYVRGEQRFTLSFNLASMAYAMPAAIGLQLHYPDRQVISLSGDGGFNMLMGDFLTAVKYQLPIKVVIFNNAKLGLIKMEQEAEGYPESETDLRNPDYAALARAMGGSGFAVESPAELRPVLQEALGTEGPVIIDVRINPDELTLPPKIKASQAIGFGLAKLRELMSS